MVKKFDRTTAFLKEKYIEYLISTKVKLPTISAFCQYCGINRKTFYAHFASMDELLSAIIIDKQLLLGRHYQHYMDIDPTRSIRLMVYYFHVYMVEEEAFFRVVFTYPELQFIYQEIFDFFCANLKPVFEPLKFSSEAEMRIVIQCFSYALYAPYRLATQQGIPFAEESLMEMTLMGFNIHEYIKEGLPSAEG